MKVADKREVFRMMRTFYDSPAVDHTASDATLKKDIDDCLSDLPYLEGFVMEQGSQMIGYAMTAVSYTTEYGGICIWIEDLYLEEAFRGKGAAGDFFAMLDREYPDAVHRLEAERENRTLLRSQLRGKM